MGQVIVDKYFARIILFNCLYSLGLLVFCKSRWRPQKVDKRMVLEYTHGLFIT
jgi:hypothetical protein